MKTSLADHLAALEALPHPPTELGKVLGLVLRPDRGTRARRDTLHLTPEGGILGDRWGKTQHKSKNRQVSAMRLDVLRTLAADQDTALSGDNLHVDLDCSEENLPVGCLLQIGQTLLQVSPQQHLPCAQFVERYGQAAHDVVLDPKWLSLRGRGVLLSVIEGGSICAGDSIKVIRKG